MLGELFGIKLFPERDQTGVIAAAHESIVDLKDPLNEELGFYINLLGDEFCQKDEEGNLHMHVPAESSASLIGASEKTEEVDNEEDEQGSIEDDENDDGKKSEDQDDKQMEPASKEKEAAEAKRSANKGRWTDEEHQKFL